MRRRILVTGGAGFIGSNLLRLLRRTVGAEEVVILDDFSTGRRENIDDEGIEAIVNTDVASREWLREDVITEGFDEIYHLACPASPPQYQREPVDTILTAFDGTLRVLELAEIHGSRVVIASTSEVYGSPASSPQAEGYWGHVNPIGLRSCYDEGKRAAEALAVAYRRQLGVDVRIARIFNTYGPGMRSDDGRVVSNFICQALLGDPITIYGDGQQTRSFCYVDDLVDGLVRLMRAPPREELATPVNLGNPRESTIAEIAGEVVAAVGTSVPVRRHPLPEDDPPQRCPDIAKARALLGWEPRVTLEEGLAKTVAYFRRHLGLARAA